MGRDKDRSRPVQPGEARRSGSDPDDVRLDFAGDRDTGRGGTRETSVEASGSGLRRASDDQEVGGRGERRSRGRGEQDDGQDGGMARRDTTRWGPVWAGLTTALTTFLLLQLLAIGLGLVGIGPESGGFLSALVPAILGLIAFFVGGLVAGITSAVRGPASGLLNGFLVWALGTVAILLLSALGLGQIFGALGNVVGQVGVLQDLQQGGAPNVDAQEVAQTVRNGALGAFFGLLLSAVAAMIGGLVGGSPDEPLGSEGRESG